MKTKTIAAPAALATLAEGVDVGVELVGAVLELVVGGPRRPWQPARLARRDEAGADRVRQGGAEDEAPRLGGGDMGDRRPVAHLGFDRFGEPVEQLRER